MRQHNGPEGNQDVWHFDLHMFPRYAGDGLDVSPKTRYVDEECTRLAMVLRAAIADEPVRCGIA